ncbi:glucans biosynthesis glucosyltransferase MdoH [Rhizosaccharibacter radicis]|uniref:Glucans biosynthesis glucosyltransferase H n=1 Tax=Rhizosaccharibacter radicis TaxID=2782605 RepID=A0ABT1W1L1_9PROT|nr:glucans biosynthesis glucosyltransferase MdoH [Acetobacteraceae bacterium KSS12]
MPVSRSSATAAFPARPGPARLALLLVPTLLLTLAATGGAIAVFGQRSGWFAMLILPLLLMGYGRSALTATSLLLGLVPRRRTAEPPVTHRPLPRTALLLPIFNEPVAPVAAALRVMSDALRPEDNITVFVLSDTQDAGLAAEEAIRFPALTRSASGVEVRYRRRASNAGRKAGNIAAFCREHGAAFEFAVVLDADSLMTADAIRGAIAALRDDPRAALIQTVSYPVGDTTLFGRMQQFSARLNAPMSVRGQDLWQGRRGTYWGHNAVIRLAPFMRHAVLPVLPGRAPMGGEILCHDTIEAALLQRAGWDIRVLPNLPGSYETTPSNLVDHLGREKRWCQGNLQHLRLVRLPGLTLASRVHIGMGILYYLAQPAGLLLSVALLLRSAIAPVAIPSAPTADLSGLPIAAILFWLTLFLVFGPRAAQLGVLMVRGNNARRFGGRCRLLLGSTVEQLLGTLLTPVMMVSASVFVFTTLSGRIVPWNSPPRGDRAIGWREAWMRFRTHTALGVLLTVPAAAWHPDLLGWTLLLTAGLLLSVPLAVVSGSVTLGRLAHRAGIFVCEDELMPHPDLVAAGLAVPFLPKRPLGRTPTLLPADAAAK